MRAVALPLTTALILAPMIIARAQDPAATTANPPQKTFFVPRDAALFGVAALAAAGVSALDPTIARFWARPSIHRNGAADNLASAFTKVQEATLELGGLATYGIARLAGARGVETVAIHTVEAVVAAELTDQAIRIPLGRARPSASGDDHQYVFRPFRGTTNRDYRAFPSIHTSSSFAAATVIIAETKRRDPSALWYVAPLAAVLAVGPPYARMYLDQHWASDVAMGAFVGTFYGLRIVSYAHDHPDNRIDRFFLGRPASSLQLGADGHAVTIGYQWTF